jgi:uncharacterized protein YcnI
MSVRLRVRLCAAAIVAGAAVLALSSPALAHVTVSSDTTHRKADDAVLTFRVPNEEDHATTVKVQITFPTRTPLASVAPAPVPGWSFRTTPTTFNPPIKTDDGTITTGVGSVTYVADKGAAGIPVGGFQAFAILVGPLPDVADLAFPAVQTYSDGTTVRWIEPVTDPENPPEHPAPVLTLAAADVPAAPEAAAVSAPSTKATASRSDSTARTFGVAALAVALLALGGAGVAVRRAGSGHRG